MHPVTAEDVARRRALYRLLAPGPGSIVDKLWTPVERDLPAMVARLEAAVLGERMTASLATSALRSAIARRQAVGTVVVHSNRGGQFCSRAFQAILKRPSGSAVRWAGWPQRATTRSWSPSTRCSRRKSSASEANWPRESVTTDVNRTLGRPAKSGR